LSIDADREVCPARAEDLEGGWAVQFLSCRVAAKACEVELLSDDWVGRGPFLWSDGRSE